LREREKYIQVDEEVDYLVQIVDISQNMELIAGNSHHN
jgi:hypothetical protein